MVMNVMVEVINDTSVNVTWDSPEPNITDYTVYYTQTMVNNAQSLNVSNSTQAIVDSLINNEEYQFQVVAVADLNGEVIIGQRSVVVTIVVALPTTSTETSTATSTEETSPEVPQGIIFGVSMRLNNRDFLLYRI